jgi:hypothetical protein
MHSSPPELRHAERPAPRTDPTNPYAEEAVGLFDPSRRANARSQDEPGLTDQDRDERAQAWESEGKKLNRSDEEPRGP